MPRNSNLCLKTLLVISLFILSVNLSVSRAQTDITPPVTTYTRSPSTPDGDNDWYVSPVTYTLTATDLESGVKEINYRLNGGVWQTVTFSDSLNLAPNPSFEVIDYSNTPIIQAWTATTTDAQTTYQRDTANYLTGFESTSVKITTTGTGWHGVNNNANFAVASPLSNMNASVWIKTENVSESAFFKVYMVTQDGAGQQTVYLSQSSVISGTNDWTQLSLNFVVTDLDAVGVYLDIGLNGTGTVWADAVTISHSNTNATTDVVVGQDGEHTLEFYSVDRADNAEIYSCATPVNCATFKIDQTPPGNWHDSGAFRGLFGASHELYVYTFVEDVTSGLSTLTDKYQYHTDFSPVGSFGRYTDISDCSSAWLDDEWVILISPPFLPGVNSAYLLTPKTNFCNNDWKTCKTVRFWAEDMAGNFATKDFCINGPWVKFDGGGTVRANGGINMISEPEEDNTDGLVEIGNTLLSFFTSSTNWVVMNSIAPTAYDYDKLLQTVKPNPTDISALNTSSGVFRIDGNYEIRTGTVPNSYDSDTFTQIVFVNGDLRISRNVNVAQDSAALFIVKGNVEISKSVDTVGIAIFSDGDISSAYDLQEGEAADTLALNGMFSTNKFHFQRTLQGTNNTRYPSESFTYEAKYLTKLRDYLGVNSVRWLQTK